MPFRFAIGLQDGPRSCSWRYWTWKEDVYLLERGSGTVNKFSFHKSGKCRWASINARRDGADRALHKWDRDPVPPAGSGLASLLVSLVFPTSHLSAWAKEGEKVTLIEPAPPGSAVKIDFFLTRENRTSIEEQFRKRNERQLAFFKCLPSGVYACAATQHVECGPVELKAPRNPPHPGHAFGDLRFPETDEENSGRPIRMYMMALNHVPPEVWELGGYETSRAEPESP